MSFEARLWTKEPLLSMARVALKKFVWPLWQMKNNSLADIQTKRLRALHMRALHIVHIQPSSADSCPRVLHVVGFASACTSNKWSPNGKFWVAFCHIPCIWYNSKYVQLIQKRLFIFLGEYTVVNPSDECLIWVCIERNAHFAIEHGELAGMRQAWSGIPSACVYLSTSVYIYCSAVYSNVSFVLV